MPAFSAVLERHGPARLAFCRAQAGYHRGEDVFQESMLAALRAYDTAERPAVLALIGGAIAIVGVILVRRGDTTPSHATSGADTAPERRCRQRPRNPARQAEAR